MRGGGLKKVGVEDWVDETLDTGTQAGKPSRTDELIGLLSNKIVGQAHALEHIVPSLSRRWSRTVTSLLERWSQSICDEEGDRLTLVAVGGMSRPAVLPATILAVDDNEALLGCVGAHVG